MRKHIWPAFFLLLISISVNNAFSQDAEMNNIYENLIRDNNFTLTSSSFEMALYDYEKTRIDIYITNKEFRGNEYSNPRIQINRPGYIARCQFSNPREIEVFLNSYLAYVKIEGIKMSLSNNEERVLEKYMSFSNFNITFRSNEDESAIIYSNCDYEAEAEFGATTEGNYLLLNELPQQIGFATEAMNKWGNYKANNELKLESNNAKLYSFNSRTIDYSELIDEGLLILDIKAGENSNFSIKRYVEFNLYHGTEESGVEYDFINNYGEPIKLDMIDNEDMISAIRANLESDAYALNNVQVTELNNFPSTDISMGYKVTFEALTNAN